MFILKKEFAGATISVGKYRLNITKENVKDSFIQKVIAETKSIHHMFEGDKTTPEPKAVFSVGAPKDES
jgi:hypothetical protein